MTNEEWREVEKFPEYQVSNLGRVRRITYKTFYLNDWNYPVVELFQKSKKKMVLLHRLVAKAFVPNPDDLPEVNHKDGNKQNFLPENLEWMTRTENRRHAARTGLHVVGRGEKSSFHKLTDDKVKQIHELAGKMKQIEIAKIVGVSQFAVGCVVRGQTWSHIPWAENESKYTGRNEGHFRDGWSQKRGEESAASKLTDAQVLEIRTLDKTLSYKKIAEKFGISRFTVGMIIRRKTWTHI